jgi:hypothetical protein
MSMLLPLVGMGEYRCTSKDRCGRESSDNKGPLGHANISFDPQREISFDPEREVQYLSTELREGTAESPTEGPEGVLGCPGREESSFKRMK